MRDTHEQFGGRVAVALGVSSGGGSDHPRLSLLDCHPHTHLTPAPNRATFPPPTLTPTKRNFVADGQSVTNAGDVCNGHGTAVASQCCGATLGAATGARIIPIRVFTCDGTASTTTLIDAINYMIATAATTGRRSVINYSGGSGASPTLDAAVEAAAAAGILFVDAAGNEAVDACTTSPARAPGSVTVAASTAGDSWAYFTK